MSHGGQWKEIDALILEVTPGVRTATFRYLKSCLWKNLRIIVVNIHNKVCHFHYRHLYSSAA